MGFSGIVTLFSDPPQPRLRPSTLLASILVHGAVFSLIGIHVLEQHRIIERFPQNRFAVRVLDFHSKESQATPAAGGGIAYHPSTPNSTSGSVKASQASTSGKSSEQATEKPASAASSAPAVLIAGSPATARLTPQRMPAPQTLLQPDLPQPLLQPQKTPVPLVVLWKPEKVAPKAIVLPTPDRASIAISRPSLEMPLKEENLADLRLASSAFVTQVPAVRPSTTSPVVVKGIEEVKKVPQTTSKQPDPPTPSRLLSLSDVRVAEGKVTVPLANQTDKANAGKLVPGQLKGPSLAGNGDSNISSADKSAGKGAGDRTDGKVSGSTNASDGKTGSGNSSKPGENASGGSGKPGPNATAGVGNGSSSVAPGSQHGTGSGSGQDATAGSGSGQSATTGSGAGPGVGNSSSTVHISLPKDGQFGVVVFGSAIAERYPETAEMWSGRMASTVYLRVGQPKSWILQYAPPRLDDAANAGAAHIDAPWPYEIARPTIDPADLDADALILHGFVNKDGRFEKLEVVFPSGLAQAPAIESALNQWQFRPAKQNGQAVPVEVLLIIPDQSQ